MILLMQLFLAHILGDFILQPNSWVKHKEQHVLRSTWLYVHVCMYTLSTSPYHYLRFSGMANG